MAKLTADQTETLRVLGDGDWYVWRDCDEQFRRTFPSLIKRGLLAKRGGVGRPAYRLPVEVRITDAGRAALAETKK